MSTQQPDNILDWQSEDERNKARQPQIGEDERVLWQGAPNIQLLLEHPDWDRSGSQRSIYLIGMLLVPVMVGFFAFSFSGSWLMTAFLILMFLCLLLVSVPPHFFFYRFLKYNKTYYTITDQKIGLYIDYGYNKQLNELEWGEVRSLRYTPFEEDTGTIHFILKDGVPFHTYNFINKEERQFPTMELVDKGEEVFNLLNDFFLNGVQGR